MPRFFFHLRTEIVLEPDPTGLPFPDLERAYLEACRAIPDMAADFIAEGRDPMGFRFEIAGSDGNILLEVPFRELERPRAEAVSGPARLDSEH